MPVLGRGSHNLKLADACDLGLELSHCRHQIATDLGLEVQHLAVVGRHALGELQYLVAGLSSRAADDIIFDIRKLLIAKS